MQQQTELIEQIEKVVGQTRYIDKGLTILQLFAGNSPLFEPEKRRFLQSAALLAGLIASGQLLNGCSTVQFEGKTYRDWEVFLLTQDPVRGPALAIHPETRLPSDFEHHQRRPVNRGWGSVDYDVPNGTPIVPTADAYAKIVTTGEGGNLSLLLAHHFGYRSTYAHLSRYAKTIVDAPNFDKLGPDELSKTFQAGPRFSKAGIAAFSGNTGRGPGPTGHMEPHLDFRIYKREQGKQPEPPGLDPFTLGIDQKRPVGEYGGRPVYWDAKTEITFYRDRRLTLLKESLDALPARLREQDELDMATVDDLLKRHNKTSRLRSRLESLVSQLERQQTLGNEAIERVVRAQDDAYDLRDYLGERVLNKKPSAPDGKRRYEFLPGSLMYALTVEFYNRTSRHDFIAFLPFIFPPLKRLYEQANPNVQL